MLVLADSGVDWFLLLLDDIPLQPGLGPRHAALTTWLVDGLRARIPDVLLTVARPSTSERSDLRTSTRWPPDYRPRST